MDILCTGDIAVRTKLVRNAECAAVCVSEAVSYEVLRVIGLPVADCHAVTVSAEFAEDLTTQYEFEPAVRAGRHWGTTRLTNDALEVEFKAEHIPQLREPRHLLTLYAADVLLANSDRRTYGNVLLLGKGGRGLTLLAIDQSDCFNHPSDLRNPDRLQAIRNQRLAEWLPGLETLVLGWAPGTVLNEVRRIQGLAAQILEAVRNPPDEWYDRAEVDPASVREFLAWRLQNLHTLIDIPYWDGLVNAVAGGHVLNL